mgnify:CR=1 FL=1
MRVEINTLRKLSDDERRELLSNPPYNNNQSKTQTLFEAANLINRLYEEKEYMKNEHKEALLNSQLLAIRKVAEAASYTTGLSIEELLKLAIEKSEDYPAQ